jgi:DnaJ-class molecular chaperone
MAPRREIVPCTTCNGSCVQEKSKVVNHHDWLEEHWYELCHRCDGEGLLVKITDSVTVDKDVLDQRITKRFEATAHERLRFRHPKEIYTNFGEENAA